MDPSRLSTTRDAGQVLELKCAGLKILNKALSDGSSSCMMGSEGFSFCDTEHLWWRLVSPQKSSKIHFDPFRDDHWFDWDLCSLCSSDDQGRKNQIEAHQVNKLFCILALSTGGYLCQGECTNTWNNMESLAPRCKIEQAATTPKVQNLK